jgi:hypothetical protein
MGGFAVFRFGGEMAVHKSYVHVRDRNTLRYWLVAVGVAAFGGFLMWIGLTTKVDWLKDWPEAKLMAGSVGSLLVGSVAITVLHDLFAKRQFADELYMMMGVSVSLERSGIVDAHDDFYNGIRWGELFDQSSSFQMFAGYARTWRGANRVHIQKFLQRSNAKATIVLPDPKDPQTVADMARRFSTTSEEVVHRINESIDDFRKMAEEAGQQAITRLEIRLLPGGSPTSTIYVFDRFAIVSLYSHTKLKKPVPCFVLKHDGELYPFFKNELDAVIQASTVVP